MKKKKITQLDLFSGIGGFHLGFEKAGYKVKSYFSEIDKHAVAVYKHKFKDAEYVGSVIDIDGNKLPRIDLITFGSPCQDFSLAGKRKGMEGDRSSLVLEAIRLIDECRPSVFIWENVKGTFSSNDGADFAAILQAFTNIGGYRLEWELLNTSRVLPQNRERIYLVGYSTKPGRNWRGVFPIGESAGENTKLQRQQANACTLTTRYGADGNGSYVTERKLDAQEVEITDKRGNERKATKASTLVAGYYKLPSDGDYVKVNTNYNYKNLNKTIEQNPTAFKEGEPKAIDCYNKNVRDEVPCLTSPEHNTTRIYDGRVIQAARITGRNPANPKSRESGLPTQQMLEINDNPNKTNCLSTVQKDNVVVQPVQIGQSSKTFAHKSGTLIGKEGQDPFTIRSSNPNGVKVEATTCRGGLQKNAAHFEEKSPALTSAMGMGGGHTPIVDQPNYRIRRLTPIECERLQGFPDNHTEYGNYEGEVKKMSNTQRYKQCGNAVTVDIVALVANAVKPLFK